MRTKIFKNILYQIADRAFTLGLNLILLLVLTRNLSLQKFGNLNLIQSYIQGFLLFTDLGINTLVLRELSAHKQSHSWVIKRMLTLKLLISLIIYVVTVASILSLNYDSELTLGLILYSLVLLLTPLDVITSWFQAELLGRALVWTNTGSLFVGTLASLLVLWMGGSLLEFVLVLLFQALLRYGLVYLIFVRHKMQLGLAFDLPYSWQVLKQAIPLSLAVLVITFSTNITLVLLSKTGGPEEVALYAAGSRFNTILLFLPEAILTAIFPVMVNYYNQDNEATRTKFEDISNKLTYYFILLALPLGIITTIFAAPIMFLVFGSKYQSGTGVLQIIIWYVVIMFIGLPGGRVLLAANRQKINATAQIIASGFFLVLGFSLVPALKSSGLALIQVVFITIVVSFQEIYVYRRLKIKRQELFNLRLVILPAFLIAMSWLVSGFPLAIAVGLSLASYLLLVLGLRLVPKSDWLLLKGLTGWSNKTAVEKPA